MEYEELVSKLGESNFDFSIIKRKYLRNVKSNLKKIQNYVDDALFCYFKESPIFLLLDKNYSLIILFLEKKSIRTLKYPTLISFIEDIRDFYNELKEEKLDIFEVSNTTFNLSKINGGNLINAVPDYCEITFDFRTIKKEHNDLITEKVNDIAEKYKGANVINCKSCGKLIKRNSNAQIYCKECKKEKDREKDKKAAAFAQSVNAAAFVS